MLKKPRGRPRKNCTWDPYHGWMKDRTGDAPATRTPALTKLAAPTPEDVERVRKSEEAANAAVVAEAAAAAAAATAAAALTRLAQDKKDWFDKPRVAAEEVSLMYPGVPVFYLDRFNTMHCLPKSGHGVQALPPKKRLRHVFKKGGLRRVVGPSVEHKLDEGESEYLSD